MLPFLKKNDKSTGLMIEVRKPDNKDSESQDLPMESAARDIIDALEIKDHKKLAAALRNAFQILELEPHEEVEHEEMEQE